MKRKVEKLWLEKENILGLFGQSQYATQNMQVMYIQVFQDLKFCDAQIHSLESNVKVHEEKESILKFRF